MSKRILVVEDQPDNRQIIRDMLAPTDYEIIEAKTSTMTRWSETAYGSSSSPWVSRPSLSVRRAASLPLAWSAEQATRCNCLVRYRLFPRVDSVFAVRHAGAICAGA